MCGIGDDPLAAAVLDEFDHGLDLETHAAPVELSGAQILLVPAPLAGGDSGFKADLLGERRPATVAQQALYDPDGTRMRG